MAQMTAPGVNCDIRSYDKFAHLLICPPVKKVFFGEAVESILWTVGEMAAESAKDPGYESCFVRKFVGSYLSSVVGVDASAIDIISGDESSIPCLHIPGRQHDIDISMSHLRCRRFHDEFLIRALSGYCLTKISNILYFPCQ